MSKMYFATTRFTDKTAQENQAFLTRVNRLGTCIIGSNQPISDKIPQGALILVVMMHIADETQKRNKKTREMNDYVSGICLVENIHRPDRYCNIYDDIEYNQVTYTGQDPVSREELSSLNPLLVEVLDIILFKGKTHQKRCKYITELKDEFLHKVKIINANGDFIPSENIEEDVFLLPRQELRDLNVKQSILDIFQSKSFAKTAHLRVTPSEQEEAPPPPQEVADFLGDELVSMLDDAGDYVNENVVHEVVCCPEDFLDDAGDYYVNENVAPEVVCCPEDFLDDAGDYYVNENVAPEVVCCPEEFLDEVSSGKRTLYDEELDDVLMSFVLDLYCAEDFEQPLKRHETVLYEGYEVEVVTV